ncbi:WD40/YVTN/BNR-like repeat-containing protein [Desulfovibrio sp. TomC]|uniref:WD40/YVTN/BNR-like repeat-containing protein n=1 Tax=Desulfovibrio sp. TomC TaxID=1562888 RepID=UPI0005741555|nr:sialidase family protein [Desulfovibrio sp. TomC]KHK03765.1 Glycosyl hydrolase, BNR repeat precursor [Desulfovibrio sp. TomC]
MFKHLKTAAGILGCLSVCTLLLWGCSQSEAPVSSAKPAGETGASTPAFKPGVPESKQLAALDPVAEAARLQKIMERKRAKPKKSFDKPREAQIFFAEKRAPVGETAIPVQRYVTAMEAMRDMPLFSTRDNALVPAADRRAYDARGGAALGNWTGVGPGNVGGRIRSMVIDPATPATMYIGGVAGGVWKTTNAGTTWTPLTDLLSNLAVCSMAMDPKNSSIIYAGTGEGYYNVDAVRGAGIFKTTNAGTNWTQLASTANEDFYYVNKVVVSPNDSTRLYAATRKGVAVSTDTGASWTLKLDAANVSGCTDLVVRTDVTSADTLVASCGTYLTAPTQAAIHRSTDNGQTWTSVHTQTNMDRTSLAIAKSDQSILYALVSSNAPGNWNNGLLTVLKSVNGGASWVAVYTNLGAKVLENMLLTNVCSAFCAQCEASDTYANQGWYDNVIAVDPINPNIVWTGGIDLFRSDNGGVSWGLASVWWANTSLAAYNHADHHVLVFHPNYNGDTNKTLYNGNDGGLFRTDNARADTTTQTCSDTASKVPWVSLNNGLGITQYYYGAVYPGGGTFFGGAQDNGTTRGSIAGGANAWATLLGGDGGGVAVNPQNTNTLYGEYTNLSLQRSINGGTAFAQATTGITEASANFAFIAPFTMDPNNPANLWIGGKTLWRTTNGADAWTQASTALAGNGTVSAIAVAPGNSNLVAVGTNNGSVFVSTTALSATAATVWSSTSPVAGQIASLAFDPGNSSILYATCSNFGQPHVLKSSNRGATWTTITGTGSTALPDIPTFALVVDPNFRNRLYVGTDLGVFASLDGGASWAVENSGFANVITESLRVEPVSKRLYAFTHGRGVWYVPLPAKAASGPAADLLLLKQ